MPKKNPILSMMGNFPARGRADVKTDFLIGKKAEELGDKETCLQKAKSLGRFAINHIPFAVASGVITIVHAANIKNGNSYSSLETLQTAFSTFYTGIQAGAIYAQNYLSRNLMRRAEAMDTQESSLDPDELQQEYSAIERPGPNKLDRRMTDGIHLLMGASAVSALITVSENMQNY